MQKNLGEIFDLIAGAPDDKARVKILKDFNKLTGIAKGLRTYLRMAYDGKVTTFIPEGIPKHFRQRNVPGGLGDSNLLHEVKKIYRFVGTDGIPSSRNLNQARRENLFLQVLEALDNNEQDYFIKIKDKTLDIGLTKDLINQAIPGLIVEDNNTVKKLDAPDTPKKKTKPKKKTTKKKTAKKEAAPVVEETPTPEPEAPQIHAGFTTSQHSEPEVETVEEETEETDADV